MGIQLIGEVLKMNRLSVFHSHHSAHLSTHSLRAMKAAKRMAASRNKERNSKLICHHLLQMLEVESDNSIEDDATKRTCTSSEIKNITENQANIIAQRKLDQYKLQF